MQKLISNQNQHQLLENDLKSKSKLKNLISNSDFKSFNFKSYPTLATTMALWNQPGGQSRTEYPRCSAYIAWRVSSR